MLQAETSAAAPLSDAEQFFRALFPNEGYVAFRTLFEGGRKGVPSDHTYALGAGFDTTLAQFVEWCALEERSAFVVPGLVSPHRGGCKDQDVVGLVSIVADIDTGDTLAKLAALEALLGPPTVIVESGGATEFGPKVHVYHRLAEVARGADIARVCAIQAKIAEIIDCDSHFGHSAQIIRLPSTLHRKDVPTLVKLRSVDPDASVNLLAAGVAVCGTPKTRSPAKSNVISLNFGGPLEVSDVDRALTGGPIHAEGVDGITRFKGAGAAIGHFVRMARYGRTTIEEAWTATVEWNAATLRPPWDETRLRGDFERLLKRDTDANGPFVPQQAPALATESVGARLTDWNARRFKSPAPVRNWLVDGLIQRGTPGVFAAVGDAGKSMLALRLALIVGCHSAPIDGGALDFGRPRFFGQPVIGRGTAVVLTGEDDADEVNRRLDALDPTGLRQQGRLLVLPLLSAGGARAIVVNGRNGPELTPFWRDLREQLLALPDLALVVLDPLTQFVGADTNDNTIGAAFMGEMNSLAAETGAAVMLIHHLSKGGTTRITGISDARNAVLGASAWVNNSRWALVLWEAERNDATAVLKALGQQNRARQAGLVYCGGLAKSNAPGAKVMRTLVRNATTGILDDVTDTLRATAPQAGDVDAALHRALCEESRRANGGFVFTSSASALWEAWGTIIRKHDLPLTKDGLARGKEAIKVVFERLLDAGLIAATSDQGRAKRFVPVELEAAP